MSGIATVPVCRLVSHVTVSYPWYNYDCTFDADGTPSAKRRKGNQVKKSHSLDARMSPVAEDINGGCHGCGISFNIIMLKH